MSTPRMFMPYWRAVAARERAHMTPWDAMRAAEEAGPASLRDLAELSMRQLRKRDRQAYEELLDELGR